MSKNIVIAEVGERVSLSEVDRIVTPVQAGSAGWIPDDETVRGNIRITENGEYVPSTGGYYGYYEVTVEVPGGGDFTVEDEKVNVKSGGKGSSIRGKDPKTGKTVTLTVVDENGVPYIRDLLDEQIGD